MLKQSQFLHVLFSFVCLSGSLFFSSSPCRAEAGEEARLIYFKSGSFKQEQRHQASQFLKQIERRIPEGIRTAFKKPIEIQFESALETAFALPICNGSSTQKNNLEPEKLKSDFDVTYGYTIHGNNVILLNSRFREIIVQGEEAAQSYSCGHKNSYRLAMGVVVHELAHLYDDLALKTPSEVALDKKCFDHPSDTSFKDPSCIEVNYLARTISSRKKFQLLAGWSESGVLVPTRSRRNISLERSPDRYESVSLEEKFAVNFQFYILDPEYACRRPLLHDYFKKSFGEVPFDAPACKPSKQTRIGSLDISQPEQEITLDPARVYQIHYLFASKGGATESRWGHSMFRLIVCAPHRVSVSADCLMDSTHHIVVSFRANVSDLILDKWKGVMGGYPSKMFLFSLNDVIEEYTLQESRDLISVPLVLTNEEKNDFVLNVLSHYWAYQGHYRFLTGNCANESLWFLQSILNEANPFNYAHVTTPIGLYDALGEHRLLNSNVLRDEKNALRNGYIFNAKRPRLDDMYKKIAFLMPFTGLDQYADESSATDRRNYFIRTRQMYDQVFDPLQLATRFFLFEKFIQRRLINRFQQEFMKIIEANDRLSKTILSDLAQLKQLRSEVNYSSFIRDSYGIPLESEFELIKSSEPPRGEKSTRSLFQSLMSDGNLKALQPIIDELKDVEINLDFFRKKFLKN